VTPPVLEPFCGQPSLWKTARSEVASSPSVMFKTSRTESCEGTSIPTRSVMPEYTKVLVSGSLAPYVAP
jgi:hypothetical protein